MPTYNLACEVCGKEFTARRHYNQTIPKYCSNNCKFKGKMGSGNGRTVNAVFVCNNCGKEVNLYVAPNRLKNSGKPKYCSRNCVDESHKNNGNPNYKNGKRNMKGGYVGLYVPDHPIANEDGCVYEHRIVMEYALGRVLSSVEVVHHINGIRNDNRLENLKLFANQSDHMKFHRKGGRYYENTRSSNN